MKLKNNGSTLVLLVIIIALVTVLGASIMNIAMMQYEIRLNNTEIKKCLYMSETGLNVAYANAYELLNQAISYAVKKTDEHKLRYTLDETEEENFFENSYKLYVVEHIVNCITDDSNPYVEVTNEDTLAFVGETLHVNVESKYLLDSKLEKTTSVYVVISVPCYANVRNEFYELKDLIIFSNWDV
jgi:Tfp pilus assembly protein PilE